MSSTEKLAWTLLWLPVGVIIAGWLTSTIWNWYMPVLFGLPTIGIVTGAGLQSVRGILFGLRDSDAGEKPLWESVLQTIIAMLILLAVGWFCKP